jgi:GNAT superfamily N-acetyltransferase
LGDVIRKATLDDVPQAAALRQRAWPDSLITADGMRHFIEATPERAERLLLAFEEAGELVGWAAAAREWSRSDPTHGYLDISVDPAHRGRKIGSRLIEAADAHLSRLGVTSTRGESLDEPAARALAERHGFAETGSSSTSAVDPRTVRPLPLPPDVTVVPFRELDDPEPVWTLDLEVSQDIPNEEFDAVSLEEWSNTFWRSPVIDDDASLAAFVDGQLVALTMIRIDRESGRAQNNLAGTRRAFRGRGIATALKSRSLVRAAELGATIVLTDNEELNTSMLAVNAKLGYRPFSRRITWERKALRLTASGERRGGSDRVDEFRSRSSSNR